jgi:hypothetical protein
MVDTVCDSDLPLMPIKEGAMVCIKRSWICYEFVYSRQYIGEWMLNPARGEGRE